MYAATISFTGLFAAGLVLVGFAAKAMTELRNTSQNIAVEFVVWILAVLVLMLGTGTAAVCLGIVLPMAWGRGAYWSVLFVGCGASALAAIAWTREKQRPTAAMQAQMAAPIIAITAGAPTPVSSKRYAWPHPGLEAGRAAIRANRHAQAKTMTKGLLIIAVPLTGFVGYQFGVIGVGVLILFILALIANFHSALDGISEREYRTLPGSADEHGKHRCVYCGKWGVYRQGAYASSSTWHQCTGCRKHLFVD